MSYDVTDELSVYYSNERDIWRDNNGDIYYGLASLGLRYDLSETAVGQPISFGAEYSGYYYKDGPGTRESISDLDQSQVTMTVTYSFGGTETSLFNGIRNRDRSLR
ncbi:hypothetical protein N9O61_05400 [Octadecabacter sp.]|nr:hypothetical protein [Octadecabacter sp.]